MAAVALEIPAFSFMDAKGPHNRPYDNYKASAKKWIAEIKSAINKAKAEEDGFARGLLDGLRDEYKKTGVSAIPDDWVSINSMHSDSQALMSGVTKDLDAFRG